MSVLNDDKMSEFPVLQLLGLEQTNQITFCCCLFSAKVLIAPVPIDGCTTWVMEEPLFYMVASSFYGYSCLLKAFLNNGDRNYFHITFIPKFASILAISMLYLLLFQVTDF